MQIKTIAGDCENTMNKMNKTSKNNKEYFKSHYA